ncbi:exopolysaccharide biosynthesis polyprenyl glycosylphosphotransferase [Pseudothermotoga sp.]|nr:exopolysaccharide biosynthesis polyprenyl glycosylphosphotransferase [Pseudothermotoga sp.]MDW8139696.1 exopolysaccharide biosynthesis polyprenyl glycosylphosphotransferase [Pseudothermotoga sp.]
MRYNRFILVLIDYAIVSIFYWIFSGSIPASILLPIVIFIALFSFRSYEKEHLSDFNESLVRAFVSLIFGNLINYVLLRLIYLSLMETPGRVRLTGLVLHTIFTAPSLTLINFFLFKALKKNVAPARFAVVGKKEEFEQLFKEIEQKSEDYCFVDYISDEEHLKRLNSDLSGIVIADYEIFQSLKHKLANNHLQLIFLPHIAETVLKRIPLILIDKFNSYYETSFNKILETVLKRILDIVLSTILLVLTSPAMLFVSLAIYLEDGRPIIYRQKRVGKNGEEFEFIKFRSLKQEGFDPKDPSRNIEQRLLKIGKFIRKYRLDELPQLWLVLKGTMSLVGPRPEMVEYHLKYCKQIPYYDYRLKVKPGLTGWAQIMYKYASNLEETKVKLQYDLYYVKNCSFLLDLKIIMQTLETVLWRRGAR